MPEKYKKRGIGGGVNLGGDPLKAFKKAGLWLTLSIILSVGAALVCFGLWGYKISLNNNKEELTQKLEDLQGERDLELEGNFIELKETIENFEEILSQRVYLSNVFGMLEDITLSQVKYESFTINLSDSTLDLKTEATSYESLVKQVMAFREDSRIKEIIFSEATLEKGGFVGTTFNLEFEPSLLSLE